MIIRLALAILISLWPLAASAGTRLDVTGTTIVSDKIHGADVQSGGTLVLSGMADDSISVASGGELVLSGMATAIINNGGTVTISGLTDYLQMNGGRAVISGVVHRLRGNGRIEIQPGSYVNGLEYATDIVIIGVVP